MFLKCVCCNSSLCLSVCLSRSRSRNVLRMFIELDSGDIYQKVCELFETSNQSENFNDQLKLNPQSFVSIFSARVRGIYAHSAWTLFLTLNCNAVASIRQCRNHSLSSARSKQYLTRHSSCTVVIFPNLSAVLIKQTKVYIITV